MKTFDKIPENPFILGPMAGVTDGPMRLLSRQCGAGLVCMEMVSANAIKYGNKKTEELIRIREEEHPVSLQLFGPDPETIAFAASYVSKYDYDVLDINMGCPVPKIVKNGEGSALMKDPDLAGRIVEAAVKAQDRPVTAKIRSGFSKDSINAPYVAKILESAGASAIAVHGRTREQMYEGKADWDVIREVAETVKIPVIGSGDVKCGSDAHAMMEHTGCRYVMIARAARGNPWVFRECLDYFESMKNGCETAESSADEGAGGAPDSRKMPGCRPGPAEIKDMIFRHIAMQIEEKGEYIGVREMRKHISWYVSGITNAAAIRREVNAALTKDELVRVVEKYVK